MERLTASLERLGNGEQARFVNPLVALRSSEGGLVRETALANGQRSQWVGRFMRVRPSVPTRPGLLKQLSHTPSAEVREV